jgi:hypothetical protein
MKQFKLFQIKKIIFLTQNYLSHFKIILSLFKAQNQYIDNKQLKIIEGIIPKKHKTLLTQKALYKPLS